MAQIYSSQPCECGCGEIAHSTDRRPSRRRRFIHGHAVRLRGKRPEEAPPNPSGLCMCGCGAAVKRALKSRGSHQVAGEFLRRLQGHWPNKWDARRNPLKPDDPRGPNPSGKCQCGCNEPVPIADRTDPAKQMVSGCYVRFCHNHDKITVNRIGGTGKCFCGCGMDTPISKQSKLGNIKGQPQMYVIGHRWRVDYIVNEQTGCWELPPNEAHGYGRIRRNGRLYLGHRWFYEERYGPIPKGIDLDHLCRVRACCNPDHMEPVTRAENTRRIRNHPEIPKWGDWNEREILVDPTTGCWVFPIVQQDGYARFWMNTTLLSVHRFYYQRVRGKIPDGLELDHLCRNRACVNPSHLEPVTRVENLRRAAKARRSAALALLPNSAPPTQLASSNTQ